MNEKQIFLDRLLPSLTNVGLVCDSNGDVISVRNPRLVSLCVVDIKELGVYTTDKIKLTQTIKIYNKCTDPMDELMDMSAIGKWNTYAPLLSLVKDERGIGFAAKVTLYENSDDVINYVYAPLTYAAVLLSFGLAQFMNKGYPNVIDFFRFGRTPEMTHWLFGIPEDAAKESPAVTEKDFKDVEIFTRDKGIYSCSDAGGLTLELPWDTGAVSVFFNLMSDSKEEQNNKRTSLVRIESEQSHPLLGKGLLARLQLPILVNPNLLPELVNQMNLWELNAADTPPFFGSWCIDPQSASPAYVTFIPSMYSRIVTIRSLISWMYSRHKASISSIKSWSQQTGQADR